MQANHQCDLDSNNVDGGGCHVAHGPSIEARVVVDVDGAGEIGSLRICLKHVLVHDARVR